MHNPKIWEVYDKNCWFYKPAKVSYFAFKNGQGTGSRFIAKIQPVTSVGVFKFVYAVAFQLLRRDFGW